MAHSVLVPVADGTEEIEAVCLIDVLRRSGAQVTVASVDGLEVTASRGVKLVADMHITDCKDDTFDLIVLPGGMPGAEHLRDSAELTAMLQAQAQAGRLYAAICASPAVILEHHGLLKGKKATCHASFVEKLSDPNAAGNRVVVDGNCITSRGPGTAIEFALALAEQLFDKERAQNVAGPMHVA